MNTNLYVEFHVLQTVPPSCVNRDDTGSPKTAVYGGKNRSRVSSQAWKHAMREMFNDIFPEDQKGYRTKNMKALLSKKICELDNNIKYEDAEKTATVVLESSEVKSRGGKKDVLFFISSKQIDALAEAAIKYSNDKSINDKEKTKLYKDALMTSPSIDLVLFGRMAANDPNLNYDAAAQVAHSISTHAVSNEYDYFTAVDDFKISNDSGAGYLSTVEFNSSTLYRYANINVIELLSSLSKEETLLAVRGFAEAFIRSMPTGKQNSFANRTLPDFVYVTIRHDQPINLVNAFEKPIVSDGDGNMSKSQKAFIQYTNKIYKNWVSEPDKNWVVCSNNELVEKTIAFPVLLDEIENAISEFIHV